MFRERIRDGMQKIRALISRKPTLPKIKPVESVSLDKTSPKPSPWAFLSRPVDLSRGVHSRKLYSSAERCPSCHQERIKRTNSSEPIKTGSGYRWYSRYQCQNDKCNFRFLALTPGGGK